MQVRTKTKKNRKQLTLEDFFKKQLIMNEEILLKISFIHSDFLEYSEKFVKKLENFETMVLNKQKKDLENLDYTPEKIRVEIHDLQKRIEQKRKNIFDKIIEKGIKTNKNIKIKGDD